MSVEDQWITTSQEIERVQNDIELLSGRYPYWDPESGVYMGAPERVAALKARQKTLERLKARQARIEAEQREQNSLITTAKVPGRFPRTEQDGTIPPNKEPIVWYGEKWEWVKVILELRAQGFIKAESDTDALNQMAPYFVARDRRRFNVRSVLQSYNNKRNPKASEGKAKPRS